MSDAPGVPSAGERRCGLAAIVGAPNVGKSTLVNRLVGRKVSIVSPKVQTTRHRVLGVAISGTSQVVLVDTPGLFAPRRRLDRAMVASAWESAGDADHIVYLVDATRGIDESLGSVVGWLRRRGRQAVLLINKIDLVAKETLLSLAARLHDEGLFAPIFMVSALTGDGVEDARQWLAAAMPVGPWLFPDDQVSDQPLSLFAAELTREKLFRRLRHELPYAVHVETEAMSPARDGGLRIVQNILVARDSQKAIIIGNGGAALKAVGEAVRRELRALLGQPVHLFITVRVDRHWAERRGYYSDRGLGFDQKPFWE